MNTSKSVTLCAAAALLLGVLRLPAAVYAQEVSTAPASTAPSPLFLTFSKDSSSSRVGLDYRVRWDFSDLASFRPSLGFLYSGLKSAAGWDITENTRLDYYGFKTNPWRLIITKEKNKSSEPAASAPASVGSGIVKPEAPEYHKRLRLSVSPLVDDIKRNFDENLRSFLLKSSLKGVSPEWEKTGEAGRKAFVKDVLSIGIWDSGVPGMKETEKGLEYLEQDGKGKGRKKPPNPEKVPI